MRVSYFGYRLDDTQTRDALLVDLRDFVSGFVAWRNWRFKQKLQHNGERLFLLPYAPPVYLFVQARDHEIIKRLDRRKQSVTDIQRLLGQDESIGFASYVLWEKHFIGIASRVLSPRITALAEMFTTIFAMMGQPHHRLVVTPFAETLERKQVSRLVHVGAVAVEMNAASPLLGDFLNLMGANSKVETENVASIEVIIRPYRGKMRNDIKPVLKGIVETVPLKGLEMLEARAKVEAGDRMTDVFIVGAGAIRDEVTSDDERKIASEIEGLAANNERLRMKLKEYERNEKLTKVAAARDRHLDWKSARAHYMARPRGRDEHDDG